MWVGFILSEDFLERNPYPKPFKWHPMNKTFTNKVPCLDCGKPTKRYRGKELCKDCRLQREIEFRRILKEKSRERS
jgi:predicted amidophosphoribosyltransferase